MTSFSGMGGSDAMSCAQWKLECVNAMIRIAHVSIYTLTQARVYHNPRRNVRLINRICVVYTILLHVVVSSHIFSTLGLQVKRTEGLTCQTMYVHKS